MNTTEINGLLPATKRPAYTASVVMTLQSLFVKIARSLWMLIMRIRRTMLLAIVESQEVS